MNDKVCEERGYHDWKVSEDFGTMADDSQYAILICKDCSIKKDTVRRQNE